MSIKNKTELMVDLSNPTNFYLKEISSASILTPTEELELFKSYHETIDSVQKIQLRDKIVNHNLKLVIGIARKYSNINNIDLLDLIQEGNIGLIKSIDKFDYKKGFKFSTYATWWIRQQIGRYVYEQGRTIRIPMHMMENINKINKVMRELEKELGRVPNMDEILKEINIPDIENMINKISGYPNIEKIIENSKISDDNFDEEFAKIYTEFNSDNEETNEFDLEFVFKTIVNVSKKHGEFNVDKIKKNISFTPEKVSNIIRYNQDVLSLDMPIGEKENSFMYEMVVDENSSRVEDDFVDNTMKESLHELILSIFDERTSEIVIGRYGLTGEIKTLEQLSQKFNISRERVRQIEKKALHNKTFAYKLKELYCID